MKKEVGTTIVYWGYIGMELYDEAHHPNEVVSFAVQLLIYTYMYNPQKGESHRNKNGKLNGR